MSCILVVKNVPNSHRRGDVITILDDESQITDGVDKQMYEQSHGAGTWDRRTVLVFVTDRSSSELSFLLEDIEVSNDYQRKYKIQPQGESSPFYDQLLSLARVTVSYSVLGLLIE